jgi:Skp family chaperone for outer membrane proteins
MKEAHVLRTCFLCAVTIVFSLSTSAGQVHSTAVATINIQQAIFDSKEGKHELAAIHTKVPQERQQKISEIGYGILVKMAPVIDKFAVANGLGVIIETSAQLPDPIFWTKQHGGNVLRKQADITKQVVDSFDGASVRLPSITGDQTVVAINIEQAVLNTDEGKRELAAIGSNITPEQKQEILQGILIKMDPVVAKVAGDSGADIVIDTSQKWPHGSVLWFAPRLDVTEQAVSAYNGR